MLRHLSFKSWLVLYGGIAAVGLVWAQGVLTKPPRAPASTSRASSAPTGAAADPYRNFNFQVDIGTSGSKPSFAETTGLSPNSDAAAYRDGALSEGAKAPLPKPRSSGALLEGRGSRQP